MGCCDTFVRFILIIVNVATVISGLILVAVGVLSLAQQSDFNDYTGGTNYTAASLFLIILGAVVLIVGLFGCFGALKKNQNLLKVYGAFIILCIILEIVLCVFAFINKGAIVEAGKSYANSTFNQTDFSDMDNLAQKTVNLFQDSLDCCGLDGPSFWTGDLPASCCASDANATVVEPCTVDTAYSTGCYEAAEVALGQCGMLIIIIAIIVLVIEILCVLAGFYSVKNNDYTQVEA